MTKKQSAPMVVGLLCGREFSFPPAFIERERRQQPGITAEMVSLGGTRMVEPARYRVIVDRISHEVEYYRAYLKHAVLQGTYVINNPFWWTADDKFFNYALAQQAGRRDSEDGRAAAEGLSGRHRPDAPSRCGTSSIRSTGTACSTTSAARRSSSRIRAAAGSTSTRSTTATSCSRPTIAPRRTA